MKKIITIISLFLSCSAWASQSCKDRAEALVEIREDYKSFEQLKGDLSLKAAALQGVNDPELRAKINGGINLKLIYGEMAFTIYPKNLKGEKLYKKVLADCVADEKSTAERRAKQDAREAAKAAKAAREK
jgi:hypothetical protein